MKKSLFVVIMLAVVFMLSGCNLLGSTELDTSEPFIFSDIEINISYDSVASKVKLQIVFDILSTKEDIQLNPEDIRITFSKNRLLTEQNSTKLLNNQYYMDIERNIKTSVSTELYINKSEYRILDNSSMNIYYLSKRISYNNYFNCEQMDVAIAEEDELNKEYKNTLDFTFQTFNLIRKDQPEINSWHLIFYYQVTNNEEYSNYFDGSNLIMIFRKDGYFRSSTGIIYLNDVNQPIRLTANQTFYVKVSFSLRSEDYYAIQNHMLELQHKGVVIGEVNLAEIR